MMCFTAISPHEIWKGNCFAYLHHKLFSHAPFTSSCNTLMYIVVLQGHFDVTFNRICILCPSDVQIRHLPTYLPTHPSTQSSTYLPTYRDVVCAHHVTRHNTPIHNILSTAHQLNISEGTRNAPWRWQCNAETCSSYHYIINKLNE
jgi:hypothetical protein